VCRCRDEPLSDSFYSRFPSLLCVDCLTLNYMLGCFVLFSTSWAHAMFLVVFSITTTPPVRDTFIADPVAVIKDKIRNDFIVPNAVDTTDATAITPLWPRCSFTISAGHRFSNRRLTLANLREAMQ